MRTCHETVILCGFKSTKSVADLNGLSPRTLQSAFNADKEKFNGYVMKAIKRENNARIDAAVRVLGEI